MMTERIGQWIGILANVGVFAGFLLVAYQLQLTRESMQQASSLQSSSLATSAEVALMGDTGYAAYAKSIMNPSELTPEELVQFWNYMSIAQVNAMQAWLDYDTGRLSEEAWTYNLTNFASYFNYPMGRVWFREAKAAAEGSGLAPFFALAEQALERAPRDQTSRWFLRMYRGAKDLGGAAAPDGPGETVSPSGG